MIVARSGQIENISGSTNHEAPIMSELRMQNPLKKRRKSSLKATTGIDFVTYDEAKAFVKGLRIKTAQQHQDWASGKIQLSEARPTNIPSCPHQEYAGYGWKGYGDYLSTGRVSNSNRVFLSFKKAREFARDLQLASGAEWREYSAGRLGGLLRPDNIPSNPQLTYKDKGWIGMPDWLGNGNTSYTIESPFWDFERAREYASSLRLKNFTEWRAYVSGDLPEHGRRPRLLPSLPNTTYKGKGWINYADWLGSGDQSPFHQDFLPFEEARDLVWKLRVESIDEYHQILMDSELAKLLPRSPDKVYKGKGWKGLYDYLGT